MVTTTPDISSPPDRGVRWFMQNQTSWSRTVLGSGVAALSFFVIGAIAVLTSHGWTGTCPEGVTRLECSPSDPLAAGLKSDGLGLVAMIAVVVGLVVTAVAITSWKRMPNRSAREGFRCKRWRFPVLRCGFALQTLIASPGISSISLS